jgi:hypothetical protein
MASHVFIDIVIASASAVRSTKNFLVKQCLIKGRSTNAVKQKCYGNTVSF